MYKNKSVYDKMCSKCKDLLCNEHEKTDSTIHIEIERN